MRISACLAGAMLALVSTGAMAASATTYETVSGVRLYKGPAAAASKAEDAALAGGEAAKTDCGKVVVNVEVRPYRRLRHLRTQGFYSGERYGSRRYTHGFYSGR